jgi:hypothetical protein
MKQLKIPDDFRKQYQNAATFVWNYIAGDCPEAETYSIRTIIEIVRDANRILEARRMGCRGLTDEFVKWLEENEYNPQFDRDMNLAVKESI